MINQEKINSIIMPAVQKVYLDAGLDSDALHAGIIKLYDLVDYDYPLEVKTIHGLTYRSASEYLASEIGYTVQMQRKDNAPLSGFLYIHHYQHIHNGYILVDGDDPIVRQRFSVAHELGHYVMHFLPIIDRATEDGQSGPLILSEGLIFSNKDSDEDSSPQGDLSFTRGNSTNVIDTNIAQMELEANQFAAELLMPSSMCSILAKQFAAKFGAKRSVLARRMATEFLVSRAAMKLRLYHLNLP